MKIKDWIEIKSKSVQFYKYCQKFPCQIAIQLHFRYIIRWQIHDLQGACLAGNEADSHHKHRHI